MKYRFANRPEREERDESGVRKSEKDQRMQQEVMSGDKINRENYKRQLWK